MTPRPATGDTPSEGRPSDRFFTENVILSRRALLGVAVFGFAVLPLWPQLSHAESEFLGRSLAVLAAAVAVTMADPRNLRALLRRPLTLPLLAWVLVAFAATFWARYPYGARRDLALILLTASVFLFLSLTDPSAKERRKLYAGLVIGAAILALWAIQQQLTGPEDALRGLRQNRTLDPRIAVELEKALVAGRALARFGNPNHLGAYLVIALWPAWHLLRGSRTALWRLGWGAILLVLLVCIAWTKSRTAVGATFVIACAIALYEVVPRWESFTEARRRALLGLAALTAIPMMAAVWLKAPGLLGGRLLESGTLVARLRYYHNALQVIAEKWPWGVGLDGYSTNVTAMMRPGDPEAQEAHNLFLDSALEIGVIGTLVLLWLLLAAWRSRKTAGRESLVPMGMLLAYVLVNLMDFESELGEFAILFGMGLGLLNAPGRGRPWPELALTTRRTAATLCGWILVLGCWWSLVLAPYMSRLHLEVAEAKRYFAEDPVPATRRAWAWQPGDAVLMNRLGMELRFRNRTVTEAKEGLRFLQRAASANPDRAYLHGNLAQAYRQYGQFDRALASVERAIERYPAKLEYRIRRRELLLLSHREEEAEEERQRIETLEETAKERTL